MRSVLFLFLLLFLKVNSHSSNIPLPSQNVLQSKGLSAGIGLGTLRHSHCKSMWTWTSQGTYSYNSTLSGGLNIKFLGGNLDSANNLIWQRYSANAKFAYSQPRYAFFGGPVVSFENTDLNALRSDFSNIGHGNEEDVSDTECRNFFEKIGTSAGYQSGIGFLATPIWGFTFGHNLDLTLKGLFMASFSGSIAFNLREQFERFKENTKNVWLSFEYSTTLIENRTNTHNIIIGLVLGF